MFKFLEDFEQINRKFSENYYSVLSVVDKHMKDITKFLEDFEQINRKFSEDYYSETQIIT